MPLKMPEEVDTNSEIWMLPKGLCIVAWVSLFFFFEGPIYLKRTTVLTISGIYYSNTGW